MHKLIGQILFEQRVINPIQLKELLLRQKKESIRLGELAIQLGFATEAQIVMALEIQVGELLYERGVVSRKQCDEVVSAFKKSGDRIGKLLIERGYASECDVLGAYQYQTGDGPV